MRGPFLALLAWASCGGGADGSATRTAADACAGDGEVTLSARSPASYACHDSFATVLSVTNYTCDTVKIQTVDISATVTGGRCGPPPVPGSFAPDVDSVAPGQTVRILDHSGQAFCCADRACPSPLTCDARFDHLVTTSAGVLSVSTPAHLELSGCAEICP